MRLYGEYIKEKRNLELLATEWGFATYGFGEGECYIEEMYIEPCFRKHGRGSELADRIRDIAKGKGCVALFTTINCRLADPTTATKAILAYGFKITKVVNDVIFLRMEI